MNTIACIKQVPDTTDVKVDSKTGILKREGLPSIVNPDDLHAVEEAVKLREQFGGKVTVISMGPPQAAKALREVYAMGVDDTILLSDRDFAGADTWATSYTLATAIKRIGDYDIIFCGAQAIDGDTAQTGPQLAESLAIPQVTFVRKVEVVGSKLTVERLLEDGFMKMEVKTPVLLTVTKDLNNPRYPNMAGIVKAHRGGVVKIWAAKDIDADPTNIGLAGSPTRVKRTFTLEPRGKVEIIEGNTPNEKVVKLVDKLKDRNVVR